MWFIGHPLISTNILSISVPAYIENEHPEFLAEYLRRRFRVAHERARAYVKNVTKVRVGAQDRRFQRPFCREFIMTANVFDEVARDKFVKLGLETSNDPEVRMFAPQVPIIPNNLTGRYCISPDELNDYLEELGGESFSTIYFSIQMNISLLSSSISLPFPPTSAQISLASDMKYMHIPARL